MAERQEYDQEVDSNQGLEYLMCQNIRQAGFLSPAFCTAKVALHADLVGIILMYTGEGLQMTVAAASSKEDHGPEEHCSSSR